MRIAFRTVAAVVAGSAIATAMLLGSLKHSNAQSKPTGPPPAINTPRSSPLIGTSTIPHV